MKAIVVTPIGQVKFAFKRETKIGIIYRHRSIFPLISAFFQQTITSSNVTINISSYNSAIETRLHAIEACVDTIGEHQLLMAPLFSDSALSKNNDTVSHTHR